MKAPDIIYTDGRNTCAPAPIFSNIDGNIKYIRADLAEQPSLPSNIDEAAEKYLIHLAQLWVDSGDANVMSFEQFLKCYETQGNK